MWLVGQMVRSQGKGGGVEAPRAEMALRRALGLDEGGGAEGKGADDSDGRS